MKHIFIFLIIFTAACTSNDKRSGLWEGISDDRLQVALRSFIHIEDEDDQIKDTFMQLGNSRAAMILVSHASLNINRSRVTPQTDALLNRVITDIIDNGRIMSLECSEPGYCFALLEYNIAELKRALEDINRITP